MRGVDCVKKTLLGLICICVLLCGCQNHPLQPTRTETPVTEAPATETQPEHALLPLLEQGIALEESSNLLYIPNQTVENMVSPEVHLLGNGLLLSECVENKLVLKHISLEDGDQVAECCVAADSGAKLCVGNGEIGICDRELGQINILDEQFRPLLAYDVPSEGDDWYLNSELDTLYIFFSDRGLLARNLVTKKDFWLVDNGFRVTPMGSANGYVIFEYTDRADQKTYTRCLNLSTATLETLPISGSVDSGIRQGETWLIQKEEDYVLVQGGSAQGLAQEGTNVRLLSPKQHLLATDPSGRNLMLFESDGSFISQCALPMSSHAMTGADFVWSGYWEGYFFTDFMDGTHQLLFWDVNADCEGDDLQILPLGETQQPQSVVEASLYERAAQLSRRFDVEIRIAEQCSLDYTNYHGYVMTNPYYIRLALDTVEDALSQYPEGFFRQLCYGPIESVRIELVDALTAKENVQNRNDAITGFAQNMGSYHLIVLDGYEVRKPTVFHELSHVIDKRLEWDALIREDALYSEEAWLALQPEGFEYGNTYLGYAETAQVSYVESGDFVSDYSMTYPTEDRSTLMEIAMLDQTWAFEPGTGRWAKMEYYAACIRDCFDTTGWPETTRWEQVLK